MICIQIDPIALLLCEREIHFDRLREAMISYHLILILRPMHTTMWLYQQLGTTLCALHSTPDLCSVKTSADLFIISTHNFQACTY
jgi:hypothetical protein